MILDSALIHIRPRFNLEIPHDKEIIMSRLAMLIKNSSDEIKGVIIDDHIILDIADHKTHYWSPQLNFRVEQNDLDEKSCTVAGLIGPRPTVWTLFMFIYFFIAIVGFVISSFGISKMFLGEYSNLILALPISILLMSTAFAVGKYGERLARDQTEILKHFVREAIYFD